VERNSAPEDGTQKLDSTQKSDKKDWLSSRILGPPNDKSADQTAVAQTLIQPPGGALHLALLQAERDEARKQAAVLLKEVQELKREKVMDETRMADLSKLCTGLQKNEVEEEAFAALIKEVQELKLEKVAAETRMADMSKLCTDLQKNRVAEEAFAALHRQRMETMRLSEERKVHAFIRSQVHAFHQKNHSY
jgi:hypothetical protein